MKSIPVNQWRYSIDDLIHDNLQMVVDQVGHAIQLPTRHVGNETYRWVANHQYRELPAHIKANIEAEIKLLMHAQRDCFRNQGKDATKIGRMSCYDSYYCDCIGIMRCLEIFGYGKFGAINSQPEEPPNLAAWLWRLESEVLEEEGYHTDNRCEWCLKKYGKDDKSEKEKRERRPDNASLHSSLQV